MSAPPSVRGRRNNNRSEQLLNAAAELFSSQGFHVTSMRDIAAKAEMLPGSIYYHFPSKEELLLAVYEEGVRRIAQDVDSAIAGRSDPWERLESACIAHLETLLARSHYAQLLIRIRPEEVPAIADVLAQLRDDYEARFRSLVDDLDLPMEVSRSYLRLMLLGAMNWAQIWYQPNGHSPRKIAQQFVQLVKSIHSCS
jgi:AcrR family transcriptional regulator